MECHKEVCQTFELDPKSLELSMGMSTDYQHAVIKENNNELMMKIFEITSIEQIVWKL